MSKDTVHDWLQIIGSSPVLEHRELTNLVEIVQDPNTSESCKKRALNRILKCNTKMVVHVTLKFFKNRFNVPLSDDRINDYLQQGTLGLIRAIEKFDTSKGYKFSTYAYRWIRCYLGRYHYKNHCLVHIPENVLCSILSGNKADKYQHLVMDASRFMRMESLDKVIISSSGEPMKLGDVIPDPRTVLV